MTKAVRYDRFGGIEVLRVDEVNRSVPDYGQALVRVKAAGIYPDEAAIRTGAMADILPSTFPSGQGSDLAGVIVFCLRHRVFSLLAKIIIGFLPLGVLGVWLFLGFSHYVVFMLSPFLAPFVVPWAARSQEKLADRVVVDLGYGVFVLGRRDRLGGRPPDPAGDLIQRAVTALHDARTEVEELQTLP